MKTIKFPKLDPEKMTSVKIYRSSVVQTPNAIIFKIYKTEIEGVVFPDKTEICMPGVIEQINSGFAKSPTVNVPNWIINKYLRTFTLDKIKSSK